MTATTPVPLGALPALHAARDPKRAALIIDDAVLARDRFAAGIARRAHALRALGVTQGDRVVLALANGAAFYESAFAIWTLGATPAVVSWRAPKGEAEPILSLIAPKAIVTDDLSLGTELPRLGSAPPEAPSDPIEPATPPHWKAMTSGGSTGRPKVILDAMPGVWDPSAPQLLQQVDDVILNPGPLYHNAPFMSTSFGLFVGATIVDLVRFDAIRALEAIARRRVRWVNMVPTMMSRIWRLAPEERAAHDLSSLQVLFHMAAPCPVWLKRAFIEWLGPERVFELYAGTERQGATLITGAEWLAKPGSVGRAAPGFRIRILDADGRDLPTGEIGEIYFLPDSGPSTTYQYLGAEARRRGDWESIGDLGHLDEDGYLFLADRRPDLILSGGANVYPAEVEAALESIPGVVEAAVVGVPDDDMGQRVHAYVYAPGEAISEGALLAALAERLARPKHPRSFSFVDKPLRDEAGKIRRSALAEAAGPKAD